jgi:hypothetical protein
MPTCAGGMVELPQHHEEQHAPRATPRATCTMRSYLIVTGPHLGDLRHAEMAGGLAALRRVGPVVALQLGAPKPLRRPAGGARRPGGLRCGLAILLLGTLESWHWWLLVRRMAHCGEALCSHLCTTDLLFCRRATACGRHCLADACAARGRCHCRRVRGLSGSG